MPTSVRLAPETERPLDRLAKRTGRSKAFYLREIIERGLEDIEDYYDAARVLERVRASEERVQSLSEWNARLASRVEGTDTPAKQLSKLGKVEAKRISAFLRERIAAADNPRSYGKALTAELGGLWRYRVATIASSAKLRTPL